jgi:outer membrane protein assembly factor BamD (BamD/ComL family)
MSYAQGLEALNEDRLADAQAAFEAVVKADPAYLRAGDYLEQVRARLHQPAGRQAQSGELQGPALEAYRQGVALFLKGRYPEAIKAWEGILKQHPGQALVLRNIEEARHRIAIQGSRP